MSNPVQSQDKLPYDPKKNWSIKPKTRVGWSKPLNLKKEPLSNRPKPTDNSAVEAWIAENGATILPPFERVAPKPAHQTKVKFPKFIVNKAQIVIKQINNGGLTYNHFMQMCNYDQEVATAVKRAIKANYGLKLKEVDSATQQAGKPVKKMELIK